MADYLKKQLSRDEFDAQKRKFHLAWKHFSFETKAKDLFQTNFNPHLFEPRIQINSE